MTIDEMKDKHAKEIKKLEVELEIAQSLPVEAKHIHWHEGRRAYGMIKYEVTDFKAACEVLEKFNTFIVEAEHWEAGCLSVMPEEINEYAKNERAVMDGASYCELLMHSYGDRRYQDQELHAWVQIGGRFLRIEINFHAPYKWMPSYTAIRDNHGRIIEHRLTPLGLGEDQFRRWAGEKPDYRFSYYWADVYNWESWKDCELEKMEKGEANEHAS